MTNEIAKALEVLAQKLGTTSEYLWNVLLKQAPISAVADFIQFTIIVFACYFWTKNFKAFITKISDKIWKEENWVWIILVSVILGVSAIVVFFSFPNTIYALINPEYWALNLLLSKMWGVIVMKKRHESEDLIDFQARRKKCNARRRTKDKDRGRCSK